MTDYLQFTYPRFQPAQALKSNDLNAIVDYLEKQERLTRVYLIGSGIFCGLDLSIPSDTPALDISSGAAVSSEGYLFALRAQSGGGASARFTYWVPSTFKISQFRNLDFSDSDEDISAMELLPAVGNQADGAVPIPVDKLEQMVIVLLWTNTTINRKSCINSCDGAGGDSFPSIRVLALTNEELLKIWNTENDEKGQDPTELVDYPYVKRLHTQKPLKDMLQPDDLYSAWKAVNDAAIDSTVTTALPPILAKAVTTQDATQIASQLKALSDKTNDGFRQYFYDYLLDLVSTYNEMAQLRGRSVNSWCPDESAFPRFVVLGNPVSQVSRMKFYRVQTPDIDLGQSKIDFLRQRLEWMLTPDKVVIPAVAVLSQDTSVRITGSGMKSSWLDQQAIPYYYGKQKSDNSGFEVGDTPRSYWSFERATNAGRLGLQGYESAAIDASGGIISAQPPRQSLCFDLANADFFRIEGHIDQGLQVGYESIDRLRKALHLPFDITCVRLGDSHTTIVDGDQKDPELAIILDQLVFGNFAKYHPGMEHHAGVPKGGTFILVYEEVPTAIGQKIRQSRDALLIKGLSFEDNLDETKNHKASLIKAYTLELNTLVTRTIIADFCLPYTCCPKVPTVHYSFAEIQPPQSFPPDADFEVQNISYAEQGTAPESYPVVTLTLENRSSHADTFEWLLSPVDMNAGAAFPYPDPIQEESLQPLLFNLKEVRKISVKLVATDSKSSQTDDASQVIDLCPNEVELHITDPNGVSNLSTIEWADDQNPFEIYLKAAPAGGTISFDLSKGLITVTSLTQGPSLLSYKLEKSGSVANIMAIPIRYTYPCTGLQSEVTVFLLPPPPEKPPGDNAKETGDATQPGNAADIARVNRYLDNIKAVANSNLRNTSAYKRTTGYITQPLTDWQQALSDFKSITRTVLSGLGKSGGASDEQYLALYHNLIWRWLDKTVEANPQPTPELLLDGLAELADSLEKQSIDAVSLLTDWSPDEMKTAGNTALIDTIQNTLTPPSQ